MNYSKSTAEEAMATAQISLPLPVLPTGWTAEKDFKALGTLSPPNQRNIEPVGPHFLAHARRVSTLSSLSAKLKEYFFDSIALDLKCLPQRETITPFFFARLTVCLRNDITAPSPKTNASKPPQTSRKLKMKTPVRSVSPKIP